MKKFKNSSLLAITLTILLSSQAHSKVNTPEQYMNERTKISEQTNIVSKRVNAILTSKNTLNSNDVRLMCIDAPKAINALTQLNLNAMHLFPAEAQNVLKDENKRNDEFVKKVKNECSQIKQKITVK